ncbi:hypothetical protein ACN268_22785 [Micromonospora sp. WMMD735]
MGASTPVDRPSATPAPTPQTPAMPAPTSHDGTDPDGTVTNDAG